MHAILLVISIILVNCKTNAAFLFLSGEAFLKSSSIQSKQNDLDVTLGPY